MRNCAAEENIPTLAATIRAFDGIQLTSKCTGGSVSSPLRSVTATLPPQDVAGAHVVDGDFPHYGLGVAALTSSLNAQRLLTPP